MSQYVDGYVLPVLTRKLEAYREMAAKAAKVWRDHGALEVRECFLEDGNCEFGVPFAKGIHALPEETVVFSYIVFESRAHRDEVNKKVFADPRIKESCGQAEELPFDCQRMMYGGFQVAVAE